MLSLKKFTLATSLAAGLAAAPDIAEACGGCFHAPPTPTTVSVVRGHRMVLSLGATRSTLWDQFAYSGAPGEFSWILPIHFDPGVEVGTGDDRFLGMLDANSLPVVTRPPPPPSQCPGQRTCYSYGYLDAASDSARADAVSAADVTVFRQQSVGPYDVAIVGGADPAAIRDWLSANGYVVPQSVGPAMAYYATLSMDYVAVRLRDTDGLAKMSPIRVSFPTYAPVLPLRMIAAGVADSVDLLLIVLASGRIEAANFPNGEMHDSDLAFDYTTETWWDDRVGTRHLESLFTTINNANSGRVWLTESSVTNTSFTFQSEADRFPPVIVDAGVPDAGVSANSPGDDMRLALEPLGSTVRLTRLRARLSAGMLDRDLELQAATATAERGTRYNYGTLLHYPEPPVCPDPGPPVPCGDGGALDSGQVGPFGVGGGCGVRCAAYPAGTRGGNVLWLLGAGAALAMIRRRRR